MLEKITHEPVLFQAVIQATIALVVSFGLKLTNEQIGAIMALVAALSALWARAQVTPNAKLPDGNTPKQ